MIYHTFSAEYNVRSPQFDPIEDDAYRRFIDIYYGAAAVDPAVRSKFTARQVDKKKICDLFNIIGFTCVSNKLRRIIESLEPGVHFFYGVDLITKDGSIVADEYSVLATDAYVAAELTTYPGGSWTQTVSGTPIAQASEISAQEISGRHLWRGFLNSLETIYISGALHDQLEANKVRYARYARVGAVDVAWNMDEQIGPLVAWLEQDPSRIRQFVQRYGGWAERYKPDWLR